MDTDICDCGHVRDEHEENVTNSACTIESCDCMDFELAQEATEE